MGTVSHLATVPVVLALALPRTVRRWREPSVVVCCFFRRSKPLDRLLLQRVGYAFVLRFQPQWSAYPRDSEISVDSPHDTDSLSLLESTVDSWGIVLRLYVSEPGSRLATLTGVG